MLRELIRPFAWLKSKIHEDDLIPPDLEGFVSNPLKAAPAPSVVSFEEQLKEIQSNIPEEISLVTSKKEYYQKVEQYNESNIDSVMKSFCKAHGIPLYNISQVYAYMDKIIHLEREASSKPFLMWYWRKLRDTDSSRLVLQGESTQYNSLKYHDGSSGGRHRYDFSYPHVQEFSAYDKAVPKYVLERLQKILQHFDSPPKSSTGSATTSTPEKPFIRVNAMVADYESAIPDPFMMVEILGQRFVIAVWLEPEF
jgi:hypothetical protein